MRATSIPALSLALATVVAAQTPDSATLASLSHSIPGLARLSTGEPRPKRSISSFKQRKQTLLRRPVESGIHALVEVDSISGRTPQRQLSGLKRSADAVNNTAMGQFYDVSFDYQVPYRVCG